MGDYDQRKHRIWRTKPTMKKIYRGKVYEQKAIGASEKDLSRV